MMRMLFMRNFASAVKKKTPPPPSSSEAALRGNRQSQRQNKPIFQQRDEQHEQRTSELFAEAEAEALVRQQQEQQTILQKNLEYKQMLARKAANDEMKRLRSLERRRAHDVRRAQHAQKLAQYQSNTTKFFLAKQEVRATARQEFIQALQEVLSYVC
jgi:hypothetical protein